MLTQGAGLRLILLAGPHDSHAHPDESGHVDACDSSLSMCPDAGQRPTHGLTLSTDAVAHAGLLADMVMWGFWLCWCDMLLTYMPAALVGLQCVFAAMLTWLLMGVSFDHACCGRHSPSCRAVR